MNADISKHLTEHRRLLKIRLWKERGNRDWPLCDWCGVPISGPHNAVMHEWLIKRNAVPIKLQVAIMHELNCILTHFQCHADHGQTREFKMRCAKAQYRRYGRDRIAAWVKSLGLRQIVEIPEEDET